MAAVDKGRIERDRESERERKKENYPARKGPISRKRGASVASDSLDRFFHTVTYVITYMLSIRFLNRISDISVD